MDFSNYLFRPHMVGLIMAGVPKSMTENNKIRLNELLDRKNGIGKPLTDNMVIELAKLIEQRDAKIHLTDGAKTVLDDIVRSNYFGRRSKIETKYMIKGIDAENESITLLSDYTSKMYFKNTQRKQNEFFDGECDINKTIVTDIKTSWDWSTFPVTGDLPKINKVQTLCYIDLFGCDGGQVAYCLVDTPPRLILKELRYVMKDSDFLRYNNELGDVEIIEEFIEPIVDEIKRHIFTKKGLDAFIDFCAGNFPIDPIWFKEFEEVDKSKRVRIFDVPKNDLEISQIKEMIELARVYMNESLITQKENGTI